MRTTTKDARASQAFSKINGAPASRRAAALADRIEEGAELLAVFAEGLSEAEWRTPVPEGGKDGRSVGVIVHHVASVYPVEINLAQSVAAVKPVTDITWGGCRAER